MQSKVVRVMLAEYGGFDEVHKWELMFDDECPHQESGSLNCAIYVVKYIQALSSFNFPGWNFGENECNLFRARNAAQIIKSSNV